MSIAVARNYIAESNNIPILASFNLLSPRKSANVRTGDNAYVTTHHLACLSALAFSAASMIQTAHELLPSGGSVLSGGPGSRTIRDIT